MSASGVENKCVCGHLDDLHTVLGECNSVDHRTTTGFCTCIWFVEAFDG